MTLSISTGIELELWVTDREGALADGRVLTDAHPRIEGEFVPCLLEIKTRPHETEMGLREDLYSMLRTAIQDAEQHGLRLVPLGTPLTETKMDATTTRGRMFEEIYGDGIAAAKNCAGTHIHFEKANVRRQLNLLTALDPLLALVSASPYYRGKRDLNCSRAMAYRTKCGREYRQFCQLQEYVDSVEEWEERCNRMYEDFCHLARECGVSREAVEEYFCTDDTVLNPVRLQQTQPTVEWRAPDSTLPSQIVSLAINMGELVASTESMPLEFGAPGVTDSCIGVPEFDSVLKLSRMAIRGGFQEPRVQEYLHDMGFDVGKYAPVSPTIDGPAVLSERAACRARLAQSKRLDIDLETLRDRSASDTLACPTVSPRETRPSTRVLDQHSK